ncbi:uncharacterized protein LOC105387665 [Plutella xylostella]|uniref:uncharacterized protein LOC105387665 n=1 Tax=Plutella xylostella TaxID=51655 RepID=UPI00203319E0|nr:uncharacterized protein LOC105387665 [Plutella xylostella]
MAKRANPYIEDYITQSKVHYGVKQFNNNEERLKKVYEKTLQLLFKGAKKLPTSDATLHTDTPNNIKKDNMKQLCIGKNMALEHSEITVHKAVEPEQCSCREGAARGRCAYCEASQCCCRLSPCAQCDRSYCSRCSLVGSEGAQICVSCYN